jgi:hypothetical protein
MKSYTMSGSAASRPGARWALLAAVLTAWSVFSPQAQAQTAAQAWALARTECMQEAERFGYVVESRVNEQYLGNNQYQINQRLRNGAVRNTYSCIYNARTRDVNIPALSGQVGGGAELEGDDDETVISDAAAFARAREECNILASDLGYTVLSRDREQVLGNNRYQLRLRLRKGGTTQYHMCFYNARTEEVTIPSVPGGNAGTGNTANVYNAAMAERAEEACTDLAVDRGYALLSTDQEQFLGNNNYQLRLRLRRSGATRYYLCQFNAGTGVVSIPSISGAVANTNNGTTTGSISAALAQQVTNACTTAAREEEDFRVHDAGDVRLIGTNLYSVTLRVSRGLLGLIFQRNVECHYNASTRAITFQD